MLVSRRENAQDFSCDIGSNNFSFGLCTGPQTYPEPTFHTTIRTGTLESRQGKAEQTTTTGHEERGWGEESRSRFQQPDTVHVTTIRAASRATSIHTVKREQGCPPAGCCHDPDSRIKGGNSRTKDRAGRDLENCQ